VWKQWPSKPLLYGIGTLLDMRYLILPLD